MERMGFVMTKDAKAAKMLPPNSEELKESYDIFNGGGEPHSCCFDSQLGSDLTRFNKIAIQGTPQMAVD